MIHYIPPEHQLALQRFGRLFNPGDNFSVSFSRPGDWGAMDLGLYNTSVWIRSNRCRMAWGGSGHANKLRAALGAMGEAVERLGLMVAQPDIANKSYWEIRDLGALDPESVNPFAEDQDVVKRGEVALLTRDTVMPWTYFEDALHGGRVLIPSCFNQHITGPSALYCEASTNGNGCGQTPAHAKLSAVLEHLERDAFMFYWWTRNAPRQIDLSEADPRLQRILKTYRHLMPHVTLFHTQTDFRVCSIVAVLLGDLKVRLPKMILSGAASLDPCHAVDRALSELNAIWTYLTNRMDTHEQPEFASDYDLTIWDFHDHISLYAFDDMKHAYGFMFPARPRKVHWSDLPNHTTGTAAGDLAYIEREFKRTRHPLYYCDLTPRNARAAGLHIYRAYSPDLLQVEPGHKFRALGVPRLYQLPARLGLKSQPKRWTDLNPFPHPFP